jgi:3-oxoacyl-[acyl-carrier-protein] synthase III
MSLSQNVGILGIGVYLPEEVRTNDWWPKHVVEKWRNKTPDLLPERQVPPDPNNDGERLALAAIKALRGDPFGGAVERRILPDHLQASDMEVSAAQDALARAGIRPDQIDLLLVYSSVPDYLSTPNACAVHKRLGLKEECFATTIDGACNSFHLQLTLAQSMIKSGGCQAALLIQSANSPRLLPPDQPVSTWFGDAATAVVVGPVSQDRGILGSAHHTDGSTHSVIVTGVPGKRWYEEGRTWWYPTDRIAAKQVILGAVTCAKQVVNEALTIARCRPQDVDFYASHQATPWLRRVTQEFAELSNARFVDTFKWTGGLTACNVPFCLAMGAREGLLRDGDLVATYAGGNGITWSSVVLRWGR